MTNHFARLGIMAAAVVGFVDVVRAEVLELTWPKSSIAEHAAAMQTIREQHGLAAAPLDRALRVTLDRPASRPQDRRLEATIELAPTVDLKQARVTAALYEIGGREPIAEAASTPTLDRGRLAIDVRAAEWTKGRLVVAVEVDGKPLDVVETFVGAERAKELAAGKRIPIELDAGKNDPTKPAWVTFGVPFAPGELWSAERLRLVDGQGRPLAHQHEVTGHWAREGSIQWVRFDALAVPQDGCFVEVAAEAVAESKPSLRVTKADSRTIVDTGAAEYVLAAGPSPVAEIRVQGKQVARAEGTRGLYVVDQNGVVGSATAEGTTIAVESAGPQAACVRFEGDYRTADGRRLARHITRMEFFAGRAETKIQHTLILTEDTNETWFQDVGWELALDGGPATTAMFAKGRDSAEPVSAALDDRRPTAYLLQDEHYFFAHGKNHFALRQADDAGAARTLHEGEECGDWFAVVGRSGGLGWSCRDAARQHPKEFEATRDRAVLHLFSSRGGEQLDFRMAHLVKKWDLQTWLEHTMPARQKSDAPKYVEQATQIEHTAGGWSKTHHLLLTPLVADDSNPAAMQTVAAAHSRPVYARAAPEWIYASRALGPLHPRDVENFPEVETTIEAAMRQWQKRIRDWGEYGFVDYYVGPHLSYTGNYAEYKRFHWATYGLKAGLWHVFARGGDADVREMAERCTQGFMDSIIMHWDVRKKRRGLPLGSTLGGDGPGVSATLPLYWDGASSYEMSGSTDLRQLTWSYQLTGNRRARDVLLQYGDAVKKHWSPQEMQKAWRPLMALRSIAQVYGQTWDPRLREICEATSDVLRDPDGELGLTKDRSYESTTYKTQSDVAAFLEAAEILGSPQMEETASRIGDHLWAIYWAATPYTYNNPVGRLGHFRFQRRPDPEIPEVLAMQLRRLAGAYDAERDVFREETWAHTMLFLTQGVPYAQDVVRQTGVWNEPTASWAAADDLGQTVSFVVQKGRDEGVKLRLLLPPSGRSAGQVVSDVELLPIGHKNGWGLDKNRITVDSDHHATVTIPKDAPAGAYEVRSSRNGPHYAIASHRVPLVIHAPGYWLPQPLQSPAARWYFRVPEEARDAGIFFEGSARVFRPDGAAWDDGRPQHGWVELSATTPGLWSFEPLDGGLVRVRNVPPFFACRSAEHWFEPPIEWSREAPSTESAAADDEFVAGAIEGANNRALRVSEVRRLVLEAGPTRPDGDGGTVLPFHQGTIEFYYRPRVGTVELDKGGAMLTLETEADPWQLSVMHDPAGANWYNNHTLLATLLTDGLSKRRSVRCYRQTLLQSDRWVHVAWVWGVRHDLTLRGGATVRKLAESGVLVNYLFIDGEQGRFAPDQAAGNFAALMPTVLKSGPRLDGAIDELRISDVIRYKGSFVPPPRDRELIVDDATRALFHFNGTLDAETATASGPVSAKIVAP